MNSNDILIGPLVELNELNSNDLAFSLPQAGDTVYSNSVPITLNGDPVEGAKIGIFKQAVDDGEVNDSSWFIAVAQTNSSGFWEVNVQEFANFDISRRHAFFVWYQSGETMYSADVKIAEAGGNITVNHDALSILNSAFGPRMFFNEPATPAGYNKIVLSHKENDSLVGYDPYEKRPELFGKLFAYERIDSPDEIVSVSINQSNVQISEGSTVRLTTTVQVNGSPSTELTWSSANTDIATVTPVAGTNGREADVTGVSAAFDPAIVGITATSVFDPTKSASVDITVSDAAPATVSTRAGDEQFLEEFFAATQAQHLENISSLFPIYTSSGQLPSNANAGDRAFIGNNLWKYSSGSWQNTGLAYGKEIYRIGDNIWRYSMFNSSNDLNETRHSWIDEGPVWSVKTGWAASGMSLSDTIHGVVTGMREGDNGNELRIIRLELRQNAIAGTIPESIGNLKHCEYVNVKRNMITGQAPHNIGKMTSLVTLLLGGQVEDPPTIFGTGHHPGKARKHIESNSFDGSNLPPEWAELANIKIIEFSQTRVSGSLPSEWSAMTSLEKLFLNGKRVNDGIEQGYLTGVLPTSWSTLVNLTNFTLNDNTDFGPAELPVSWSGMVNMRHFRIRRTNHFGDIPKAWETWENIRLFYTRNGSFTGELPAWLFDNRSPAIVTMEFAYNGFTSIEPVDFEGVTKNNINVLYLDFNQFGSPSNPVAFPNWIRPHRNMQNFSIRASGAYSNNFIGPMVDDLFRASTSPLVYWQRLRNFRVRGQNLGGTLPSSFGLSRSDSSTQEIMFDGCNIGGKIPATWANYRSNGVRGFWLRNNNLYGLVPNLADWKSWDTVEVTVNPSTNRINHSTSSSDFNNGRMVYFGSVGDIPDGIVEGQRYFVIDKNSSGYKISETQGGSEVEIGSTGTGVFVQYNPWGRHPTSNALFLDENRFTYCDLIPLIGLWQHAKPLTYDSQKPFPVDESDHQILRDGSGTIIPDASNVGVSSGATLTLNLSDVNVTGNVYQWRRNGAPLSNGGKVSGATTHTLVVTDMSGTEAGEYTLRITNSNAPQLDESISEPITVFLSSGSTQIK
jgi:hypothetical protein